MRRSVRRSAEAAAEHQRGMLVGNSGDAKPLVLELDGELSDAQCQSPSSVCSEDEPFRYTPTLRSVAYPSSGPSLQEVPTFQKPEPTHSGDVDKEEKWPHPFADAEKTAPPADSSESRRLPPRPCQFYHFEATTLRTERLDALELLNAVLKKDKRISIDLSAMCSSFKLKCCLYTTNHDMLTFTAKLHSSPASKQGGRQPHLGRVKGSGPFLLEFQRHGGCCMAWRFVFHALERAFLQAEAGGELRESEDGDDAAARFLGESDFSLCAAAEALMASYKAAGGLAAGLPPPPPPPPVVEAAGEAAAPERDQAAETNACLERMLSSCFLDSQTQSLRVLANMSAKGVVTMLQCPRISERLRVLAQSDEEEICTLALSTIAHLCESFERLQEAQRAFLSSCVPLLEQQSYGQAGSGAGGEDYGEERGSPCGYHAMNEATRGQLYPPPAGSHVHSFRGKIV